MKQHSLIEQQRGSRFAGLDLLCEFIVLVADRIDLVDLATLSLDTFELSRDVLRTLDKDSVLLRPCPSAIEPNHVSHLCEVIADLLLIRSWWDCK